MDQPLKNWFTQEKISKVIWQSTLPMFGAILALLAYDLLESSLLAFNGEQALTALGFTLPITTAITAIAIGMSVITNNKVVKYACLHSNELAKTVVVSLLQASFFTLILAIIFYLANEQLLALLGNSTWSSGHIGDPLIEIIHSQMNYLDARYFSWIFLAIIWQVNAIFRALGNSKLASRIMMFWLVVKSALAVLLLTPESSYYLENLDGLAVAHSSVDSLFAVISILLLHKNTNLVWPSFTELRRAIFSIKLNSVIIVLQQLITPLSIALLTIIAAKISYSYVAAFAFIFRMESIFLLLPMMLTTTMPSIIGMNYWLGHFKRVKRAYYIAFISVATVQLTVAILLLINNNMLSYFICPEGEVAELLTIYLTWVPFGYIGAGIAIVYQSCLNAEGKPLQACSVGIMHRLVLLLAFAFVGGLISTDSSLFQALMFGHFAAAIYVIYLFRKSKLNIINQTQNPAVPALLNQSQSNNLGEQL
jgi:Na+-driven multidrug efflux pump